MTAAPQGPIDPLEALSSLHTGSAPAARPTPAPGPGAAAAARPTSMVVIGWIFVVGSVLSILSGLQGLVSYRSTREGLDQMLAEGGGLPPDTPAYIRYGFVMFDLLVPLMLLSMVVSGFVLFVAVRFLQRSAWARTTLEWLCWTGIASAAGIVVVLGFMVYGLLAGHPAALVGGGIILVVGLLLAVPQAILLVFLRGKAIRSAMVH